MYFMYLVTICLPIKLLFLQQLSSSYTTFLVAEFISNVDFQCRSYQLAYPLHPFPCNNFLSNSLLASFQTVHLPHNSWLPIFDVFPFNRLSLLPSQSVGLPSGYFLHNNSTVPLGCHLSKPHLYTIASLSTLSPPAVTSFETSLGCHLW